MEVDLTEEKVRVKDTFELPLRQYLGGKGLALYILYRELKKLERTMTDLDHLDPLGPDNVLIFATGPATGSLFPYSGRYHVMALRSPLTGYIASANSGGDFGPYMKFAGFDMIVVKGAAESPVYLHIHDGKAELMDARHLWGMTTFRATDTILKEVGDGGRTRVATIGPAGENGVLFANIINDKHRAAGRTGVGAIMGSKFLKAIAATGDSNPVEPERPEEFREKVKKYLDVIRKNPVTGEGLRKYGTAILVNIINQHGLYPTRNFQTGVFEKAEEQSGEYMAEKYLIRNRACWGCPTGCGRITKVPKGPFQIGYSEGPEYESIWALGADTGNADLESIIKANHLCDELGLDTISTGTTIAAAMEMVEKGFIPEERLEGVDLRFGNSAAVVEMIWRIAYRSGFGDELAMGSYRLARRYGAEHLSMSVKRLELPAYDPRGAWGHALNYATANRGGCHVTGYMISPEILGIPEKLKPLSTEGKAKWVKDFQDFTSVVNSTVACLFSTFALFADAYADMLAPLTGWDLTPEELMVIGERIYNLERHMMVKLGFRPEEDTLPRRFLEEPMPEGPNKGSTVPLKELLREYYRVRGWENGIPTEEKLKELGIIP